MFSMGNITTCCFHVYRSANMKSASSSSSGSERVTVGSGVALNGNSDLEESKSKSASRMSCTSDDSCAINELLEGRMDLNVNLPNIKTPVVFNVERRTPMLDLLVNIATQYRFNAANYTISAGNHDFKASTPIGSLDVNQISIVPKPVKSATPKGGHSVPFPTTFRLQVNLPRNQLMVLRVSPTASIAAIKQIICSEKSLDSSKYQIVKFAGNSEAPHILDFNKTLAFYSINEVTLISNKNLKQLEMQFGATTSTTQVDHSSGPNSDSANKGILSLISQVSQSNPNIATIEHKKATIHHTPSVKSLKKRPAPPPPSKSSTIFDKNEDNENKVLQQKESESTMKSAVSEPIIMRENAVPTLTKLNVTNHVRQNSGSDSSGYHESVLSSDSPESSSAGATLTKVTSSSSAVNGDAKLLNNKSAANKKRRAPPPPAKRLSNNSNDYDKESDNGMHESKISVECMSDMSLPLSTSSSESSGADSSFVKSISPIIIAQTNGTSTPVISSPELPFVRSSTPPESSEVKAEMKEHCMDINCKQQLREADDADNAPDSAKESKVTAEVHEEEHSLNIEQQMLNGSRLEPIMCQQNDNANVKRNSNGNNESPLTQIQVNYSAQNTHEQQSPSEAHSAAKVNPILSTNAALLHQKAPALSSHDSGLDGSECAQQMVEESSISDEREGVDPIVPNSSNSECESDSILNLNEYEITEDMSLPLPPPSPFQNSESESGQQSVHSSASRGYDDTDAQQISHNSNNLFIKIEHTKPIQNANNERDTIEKSKSNAKNETPLIMNDDEMLNKEIEATLKSLNEDLDRMDTTQKNEHKAKTSNEQLKVNKHNESDIKDIKPIVNIKQIKSVLNSLKEDEKNKLSKAIENRFAMRKTPSPTPRASQATDKAVAEERIAKQEVQNSKVVNESQHKVISPSLSQHESEEDKEKLSADEVRQLCRPRVKLTNFTIGSYKKNIDIFEEPHRPLTEPATAPVKSMSKSIFTKQTSAPEKVITLTSDNTKTKVTISSTQPSTTLNTKPANPVIHTLVTNAPKINRIQSWNGGRSFNVDQNSVKPFAKANERHVTQISINKDTTDASSPKSVSPELKSPFVVQNIMSRNESQNKKTSLEATQVKPNKEHQPTIISIKQVVQPTQNSSPVIEKPQIKVQLSNTASAPSLPPQPPPLPHAETPVIKPIPQLGKVFHPKGWNSERTVKNGDVPKVRHVSPPNANTGVDVRDALLNEIKSFGGKNSLKKVSKNTSWHLEVHGNTLKT